MKYLSLFSGIGGFELGIEQAYENLDNRRITKTSKLAIHDNLSDNNSSDGNGRRTNPVCIGFSEIDKYAIQIYEKHFKHKNYGDITTIQTEQLPNFDLLVGGFPCQSFSIAGKRKGFDDTRGTLFFDIARILADKKPRHLVLENVKGLLSHDGGKTFTTIIGVLTDLGYLVEWQVLNSKNFGVPQNRERVFIIGHLGRESRPEVFPIRESDQGINVSDEKSPQTNIARTVDTRTGSYPKWGQYIKQLNQPKHSQQRVYDPSGISPTISAGNLGGGKSPSKILQLNQPKHSNDRVYSEEGLSPTLNTMQGGNRQPFVAPVLTPDRLNKRQNGRRFKENGEPSFTLTGQDRHGVAIMRGRPKYKNGKRELKWYEYKKTCPAVTTNVAAGDQKNIVIPQIRRLTPTECERLQGFPDGWTEGISDTQRYKTLGNAITVNVIKAIMERLKQKPLHRGRRS